MTLDSGNVSPLTIVIDKREYSTTQRFYTAVVAAAGVVVVVVVILVVVLVRAACGVVVQVPVGCLGRSGPNRG